MLVSSDYQTLSEVYDYNNIVKATGEDFIKKMQDACIKRNGNKIITIVGMPGSGKSWACLRLAEVLNPEGKFHKDFIAYTKKDFYDIINSDFPKGQPIVYEEVGVNESNRSFWDNMETNKIMQTFRHRNAILLMNTPMKSFADKQQRDLNHAVFAMQKILYGEKKSIIRPYFTNINPVSGEQMVGWCMIKGDLISEIILKKPSAKLINYYEDKKVEFTKALNTSSQLKNIQREKDREKVMKVEIKKAKNMGVTF